MSVISATDEPSMLNQEATINDCDPEYDVPVIKRPRKIYEFYKVYENQKEAEAELELGLFGSNWYIHKKNTTVKGQTIFYNCKKGN